jgi:hypothetical protein
MSMVNRSSVSEEAQGMTKTQGWLVIAALSTICAHTAPEKLKTLYHVMAVISYAGALYYSTKEGL